MARLRFVWLEPHQINAVVFDLGGVLIDADFRHLYRKLLSDEAAIEDFLATVCTQQWQEQHDRGRPMAEGVALLKGQHPEHAELIDAFYHRHAETWAGPIDGSVALLAGLRDRGIPVYALTNWPAEMFPVAQERFEFLAWFDGIVVSGEVGLVKPEPEIFELLCHRYQLLPEATLFVDDSPRHIEAAARVGFEVHLFTSPAALKTKLESLGLVGRQP